jgi:hypothetical protein
LGLFLLLSTVEDSKKPVLLLKVLKTLLVLESLWNYYYKLLEEDQAGPTIITFKIEPTFPIIVIKIKVISNIIDGLGYLKLPHANILEVFKEGEMVYLIYKCLSVSLVDI